MWMRLAASVSIVALSACAVQPVALPDAEHVARARADYLKLFSAQEALPGPLTLSDAMARAVHYNMDYRVLLMDQAVAMGQQDLANFDLLPRLTASAGYTERSNDSFGFGFGPDGRISANPTASQERARNTASIGFAWNALDFGLSYVRAQQLADQALITEEKRRKALQNLIQDVRVAWWRAQTAQRLLPELDALLGEIDQAASRAMLIETRRLLPPLQIVAYRRSLLDLEQQLSLRRQEMVLAKAELGALLNLPPGTEFTLVAVEDEQMSAPELRASVAALEALAVENRPELREEAYRSRLTDLEWRKQLLSLLPNLSLDLSANYDSNRYLVNNQWAGVGLNAAFGLLRVFSLPAARRAHEAQGAADEARRLAVAAAVLAQTRVAAVRYELLTHEYRVWDAAARDDGRIVQYLRAAHQSGIDTELELIRARARHVVSKVNRDFMYASVQGAIGRLYNSVGLDTLPRELQDRSPAVLARALHEHITAWERANFTDTPLPQLASLQLAPPQGFPHQALEPFEYAMQRILRLSKIHVSSAESDYRLHVRVQLSPPQPGGQLAALTLTLTNRLGGDPIALGEQKSMLVAPIDDAQWQALGESAGYRAVEPLRRLLRMPGSSTATRQVPSLSNFTKAAER
jgi:outer membrane protein TolC